MLTKQWLSLALVLRVVLPPALRKLCSTADGHSSGVCWKRCFRVAAHGVWKEPLLPNSSVRDGPQVGSGRLAEEQAVLVVYPLVALKVNQLSVQSEKLWCEVQHHHL